MKSALAVSEVRTYRLIEELVDNQGWKSAQAKLLAQQEYRNYAQMKDALSRASKTGKGHGQPEYILIDSTSHVPLAVFEGKAHVSDIAKAVKEATHYADALASAGFSPLAVAVAGTEDSHFEVRVLKHNGKQWTPITYEGDPISWVPAPDEMARIFNTSGSVELRPKVPAPEVLAEKADDINTLLRASGLKDEFRPAVIGAIMLALWKDGRNIRRDPDHILIDINTASKKAFWDAKKPTLANSLYVDEANQKLAQRAPRICQILERLNITTLTAEHDYIGALYEEFFRYTGGNTIGQYFTPRHIARFMAQLCGITKDDVTIDIACGTGGFLIAAMQQMQEASKVSRSEIVKVVKTKLIGIETEPVTAALCVANMILRGDGKTGIKKMDAFEDAGFPFETADFALMNPPFPHKKTDDPPEKFIDRALEALKRRGLVAVIVPSSLLVKSDKKDWRDSILKKHRLEAVFTLPTELFQPYASATTCIVVLRKGVAQGAHASFFCRITNDGFRLKKGVRVHQPGSVLAAALKHYKDRSELPEFCSLSSVDEEDGSWAPGAYIKASKLATDEAKELIGKVIRNRSAFIVRFAPEIAAMKHALPSAKMIQGPPNPQRLTARGDTIAKFFDVGYGQRELHAKDSLSPGDFLVISSGGTDNGAYGFFDFNKMIKPPFVSVPSTGSIGEAAVQTIACGVVDDCLLLRPKHGTPLELLYVAAATLRREAWRFDYGRKMTPKRIGDFPLSTDADLLAWTKTTNATAERLEKSALSHAAEAFDPEDMEDIATAKARLAEIEGGTVQLVMGAALNKRLRELLN